jgi:cell shape-determining protein MreC
MLDGISVRRTLEDQVLELQGQNNEAVRREQSNIEKLERLRGVLSKNNIDWEEAMKGPVLPVSEKVNGVVRAARKNASRSAELVEISVGSDDGISKSMRLIIYRGAKFICEIEVTEVYPDVAVGRVIEETRNGTIERGDNVTTKL